MRKRSVVLALILVIVGLGGASFAVADGREGAIHVFPGKYRGGRMPEAGLVFDAYGNLYGTTSAGGVANAGVVFELTPQMGNRWLYTQLYAFQGGSDGEYPAGALVVDQAGNLYGTTEGGGIHSAGIVFELIQGTDGTWTEKVLQYFGGTNGSNPTDLVFDGAGNLYGTADPNVYELSPNDDGTWTETVLYSFISGGNTEIPRGPLVFDAYGNLYGVTEAGGAFGWGTVFELSPLTGESWAENTLYNFLQNPDDGVQPFSGVIFDGAGDLFGVTPAGGGANGDGFGTVYELKPSGSGWTEAVIHRFHPNRGDGSEPFGAPVLDSAGNLYGTTYGGGSAGEGIVFRLAAMPDGLWSELRYSFVSESSGYMPAGGVILDVSGNLYGGTSAGGDGWGVIYKLIP